MTCKFIRLLFVGFQILITSTLSAQENVAYQLFVDANLPGHAFRVRGTVSFLTDNNCADSIEIKINKGVGAPKLELTGTSYSVKTSGDHSFIFTFSGKLPAKTLLEISYDYDRGDRSSAQFYLDSSYCMAGGYGSAWYPQLIIHDQEGSSIARATGTITVHAGNLMPVMASATVAASNTGGDEQYVFRYAQPDIFSLYIGHFSKHEFKSGIPFFTYSLSRDINGAELSQKAAQVLNFLKTQFGPLEIPNFSIIELPQAIAERTNTGGASLLGGVLIPTDALRKFNYALFGHEIGHQWWGNKIRPAGQQGEAMLSEGLAQYGSLQVVAHFDPDQAIRYRKNGYPGYIKDQCALGYLKNAVIGNDAPLKSLTGINEHVIADSKGFLVLDLLAETMGKPRFNKALQSIGAHYARTGITWTQFLAEMDRAHNASLEWFYRQWFDRTGVPAWQLSWEQKQNTLVLTIAQKDDVYQLPLVVQILDQSGQVSIQKIVIHEKVSVIRLPVSGPVRSVILDPDFKVIHWDAALDSIAKELGPAQQVLLLIYQQKPDEAERLATELLATAKAGDRYGFHFLLYNYLGRISETRNDNTKALINYQKAIQCASRPPDLLAKTYYKIAQIASLKGDEETKLWASRNAVIADDLNNKVDGMTEKIQLLQ